MFRNVRRHGKVLSLGQFRQCVQNFFLGIGFQGGAESLVDLFPAENKHRFSLGGELISCTGKYRSHGFILMGRGYRAEQFGADKVHQLAFTFGKTSETLLCKFCGRNDGVVVRYLFAVQHPAHIRGKCKPLGNGQQPQQVRRKMLCCLAHILGQILAVGAGIGQQFLFVKLLGIIKGLLCRETEQAVCLPLQGGQVIELGRLFCLFLPFDRSTNGSCACAFFFERIQSWKIPLSSIMGKGGSTFCCRPLITHQQGQTGLSTVGAAHSLAVDWLGWVCYLSILRNRILHTTVAKIKSKNSGKRLSN